MTFPLGSLRSESASAGAAAGTYTRDGSTHPSTAMTPVGLRARFGVLVGGVLWLLALIALATHNAADAAFSTSGTSPVVLNKVGALGARFSDLALVLFGYSAWWGMAIGLRAWLGGLAKILRGGEPLHPQRPVAPRWMFWLGVALLLASSSALEWTRLYQFESAVAGGNAGGVMGYLLGPLSQRWLGFAGSGVLWIAELVVGLALAFRFSWLRAAEGIGQWVDSLREKRVERIERAEDQRIGERAVREREHVVEVEHQLHEEHVPIVIETPVIEVPKSERVVKERQKPLFTELSDTKLPQVDLLAARRR
jgi:DNA segregation ATPase FtsK/SpoIIIE, S-DNA-T family